MPYSKYYPFEDVAIKPGKHSGYLKNYLCTEGLAYSHFFQVISAGCSSSIRKVGDVVTLCGRDQGKPLVEASVISFFIETRMWGLQSLQRSAANSNIT